MQIFIILIFTFALTIRCDKNIQNTKEVEIINNGKIIHCKCYQAKDPSLGWTAGFNPDLGYRLECIMKFQNKTKLNFIGMEASISVQNVNDYELENLKVRSDYDFYKANDVIKATGLTIRMPRYHHAKCSITKIIFERK
ncbi:hypothetical protein [Leptospira bandrabouensis]|uniref:Uncharacterized protein n=1 Tax=Leptospira bandrabouensis TaxID=2484903 RepID=A0A6H3NSP5_9LEPT|nr:hypothetical protein [Leptospira bandrabouensis]TGN11601.1 hypothetical protein EHR08_17055 [Leptospira bandrabouensis]